MVRWNGNIQAQREADMAYAKLKPKVNQQRKKKKFKTSRLKPWNQAQRSKGQRKTDFLNDLPAIKEMAIGFGLFLTYTNAGTVHAVFRVPGTHGPGVLQFWPSTGNWWAIGNGKGRVPHWLDLADVLGRILVNQGPVDHLRAIQFQG